MKALILSLFIFSCHSLAQSQSCALTGTKIKEHKNDILLDLLGPFGQIDFSNHNVRIPQGEECSSSHSIGNLHCKNCMNQGETSKDILFNSPTSYEIRNANQWNRFNDLNCKQVKDAFQECGEKHALEQYRMKQNDSKLRNEFAQEFEDGHLGFGILTLSRRQKKTKYINKKMKELRHQIDENKKFCKSEHQENFDQCEKIGTPYSIIFDFPGNQHMLCSKGLFGTNFYEFTLQDLTTQHRLLFWRNPHNVSMIRANRCPGTQRTSEVLIEETPAQHREVNKDPYEVEN